MSDLPRTPALELAAALRRRELSAVELLDACLAEVDARNAELNAVIWRDDEAARERARRADERLAAGDTDGAPFLGVPIPIKELTEVHGDPVTYGSRGAHEDPWPGPSELVSDALEGAGFVRAGRTNAPEFGHITVTENLRFGITRNPWDTSRTPGGSSGGAAAAVAGGMFPIAHANDGGGSIRIPASCCGLVGLKPSRGRVPRLAQSWFGAVVEGAVTRTVADAAAVLDSIAGPDPLCWNNAPAPERPFLAEIGAEQAPLRIGLMDGGPSGLPIDPECAESARALARVLEAQGHEVFPVEVATISEQLIPPFIALVNASLGEFATWVDLARTEPHIASQFAQGQAVDSLTYVAAANGLERLSRELIAPFGRDYDVVVTPTMGVQPPPAGSVMAASHAHPDAPSEVVIGMTMFTAFGNVTGLPGISLPVHWTPEGVPVGAQIIGGPAGESELIRLAAQVEQALPWAERRPQAATA
jgi:amidase